jgi:hypothetical protein
MFSPKDALVDGAEILKQILLPQIFGFGLVRRGTVPAGGLRRGTLSEVIAGWNCTSDRV